jgi:hypothetical protein
MFLIHSFLTSLHCSMQSYCTLHPKCACPLCPSEGQAHKVWQQQPFRVSKRNWASQTHYNH